jgi:hypothetical protein
MTFDEYRGHLRVIREQYGKNIGIEWRKHHLPPVLGFENEVVGWKLTWVGVFDANKFFLRLREHWSQRDGSYERGFFSYHYGPYEDHWDLEKVNATKVSARIDAQDYHGRGFHIHDGAKERRIYQSELRSPKLDETTPADFIHGVVKMRQGRDLIEAFGLEFI